MKKAFLHWVTGGNGMQSSLTRVPVGPTQPTLPQKEIFEVESAKYAVARTRCEMAGFAQSLRRYMRDQGVVLGKLRR